MGMAEKQARYDELCAIVDGGGELTDLQANESVQLFYELNPDFRGWDAGDASLTPEDAWHAKANGSQVAG